MKNYVIVSLILFLIGICCFAQSNEVKLVVSSDGPTKEEAIKNALRSAIEQAYGTFVSSNTEILNDELVRDEIVTVSSGNIKSYQEISSIVIPTGGYSVTLSAIVSIGKLISYAQSKGAKAEFAGQAFLQEMRMRQLNKENELYALQNLVKAESYLLSRMYDFELVLHEPFVNGDNYILPASILLTRNDYYKEAYNLFKSTLDKLALSESDRKSWIDNGLEVSSVNFAYQKGWYLRNSTKDIRETLEPLRRFCEEAAEAFSLQIIDNEKRIYTAGFNSSNKLKGEIRLVYKSENKASPFYVSRLQRDNVASATRIADLEFSSYQGLTISHFYAPDKADIESGGEQLCIHIEFTPEEIGALKSIEVIPVNPKDSGVAIRSVEAAPINPSRSTGNEALNKQSNSGPGNDNDIVDNTLVITTNAISFDDVAKKPIAKGYKTDTMLTLLRDGTTFYCYGTDSESIHVDFVVDESGKVSDITYGAGVPDRAKDSIRQLIQWLKWSPGIDAAGNPVPVRIDIDTSKSAMSSKKMMEYSKFAHNAKLPDHF